MNLVYDEKLWFFHKGCQGKHYLIGNPHTFKGRMWAWCEHKQRSFFVSKSEISECSEQTTYWIAGFLTGNEPSPPTDKEGDVNFESQEYKAWQKATQEFRQIGYWPEDEQ
ncbi:hypothetical protein Q0590_36095 [Rhodocytophaga aerolata]|uniref:Uncharacterized protein n=1 Tax=Rhodocytophaga aerolata TaxID=455078 RepID=A0ABT8RL46_9BACT|nr:hypothetical protein [Rhodocytophaga aerolata]MDO1451752.1 hypothetical protein [Rhodocytophaga aerolata]